MTNKLNACCENCGLPAERVLGGGATPERFYCETCAKVADVAGMLEQDGLDPDACYQLLNRIAMASGLMPDTEGEIS